MKNDLAILTVNYENYQVTEDFLTTINTFNNTDFKVFIADLSDHKKNIVKHTNVEVLKGLNKGYAYGINIALKQAIKERYTKFVVINNDIRLSRNFISSCLKSLENKKGCIIGGKIYYEAGYEYHNHYRKDERGKVIWYAGGQVDWRNAFVIHRGVNEVDHGQYDQAKETDFITGCLMLFDKDVIDKIGMWDEHYFLYYEDADFCERAKRNGIKLYYDPTIVIWHLNSQSTGGSGSKLHQKYQKTNQIRYGLKYAPLRTKLHLVKNKFLGQ
ncbi:MAG TPA: glycosyltransferase family 2 protein [Candidatus Nitrosocosmicus sp.]|nr:glycosyltransferase family 2 protein [Candidatus Nitrosocosmicus sp.]